MPRARLTPEERAERKKRAFSGATFRQYDPNDSIGKGDARQWRAAAGAAVGGEGFTMADDAPAQPRRANPDLVVLGLTTPCTEADVRRAYRRLVRTAHPDTGGSDAAFVRLQAAYDRLMAKFTHERDSHVR